MFLFIYLGASSISANRIATKQEWKFSLICVACVGRLGANGLAYIQTELTGMRLVDLGIPTNFNTMCIDLKNARSYFHVELKYSGFQPSELLIGKVYEMKGCRPVKHSVRLCANMCTCIVATR